MILGDSFEIISLPNCQTQIPESNGCFFGASFEIISLFEGQVQMRAISCVYSYSCCSPVSVLDICKWGEYTRLPYHAWSFTVGSISCSGPRSFLSWHGFSSLIVSGVMLWVLTLHFGGLHPDVGFRKCNAWYGMCVFELG